MCEVAHVQKHMLVCIFMAFLALCCRHEYSRLFKNWVHVYGILETSGVYTEKNIQQTERLKNIRFTAGVSQKWKPCGRLPAVEENCNFIIQTNKHARADLSACVIHDSRAEEIKSAHQTVSLTSQPANTREVFFSSHRGPQKLMK